MVNNATSGKKKGIGASRLNSKPNSMDLQKVLTIFLTSRVPLRHKDFKGAGIFSGKIKSALLFLLRLKVIKKVRIRQTNVNKRKINELGIFRTGHYYILNEEWKELEETRDKIYKLERI